jgi:hypothetical protein
MRHDAQSNRVDRYTLGFGFFAKYRDDQIEIDKLGAV